MNNGIMMVVVVEDSQFFADLTVRILRRSGLNVKSKVVSSRSALRDALSKEKYDVILSDNVMEGFSALGALEVRNSICNETPFLIISEDVSQKELEEAFDNGCDSYLPKERILELPEVIQQVFQKTGSRHDCK